MPRPRPKAPPLLVFDGDCGFCRRSLERLAQRGMRALAVPSQDPELAAMLARRGLQEAAKASVLWIDGDRVLDRGAASLAAMRAAGGRWRVWAAVLRLLPRPVVDAAYDWVARNRGRW